MFFNNYMKSFRQFNSVSPAGGEGKLNGAAFDDCRSNRCLPDRICVSVADKRDEMFGQAGMVCFDVGLSCAGTPWLRPAYRSHYREREVGVVGSFTIKIILSDDMPL